MHPISYWRLPIKALHLYVQSPLYKYVVAILFPTPKLNEPRIDSLHRIRALRDFDALLQGMCDGLPGKILGTWDSPWYASRSRLVSASLEAMPAGRSRTGWRFESALGVPGGPGRSEECSRADGNQHTNAESKQGP